MLEYVDIRPGDISLDVSGNTGKITEALPEIAKKLLSWSQNTALQNMVDLVGHALNSQKENQKIYPIERTL